uniref:Uncharacterized protein n=1 Tax=Panagrolaimus sp. ES5 TaxID=591445 RepID=A0AC34FJM8_9BILA
MDSSVDLQVASTSSSNGKDKADDSKKVVSPKKIYFTGPYRRQEWSLPDSIIYYMAMNPKSAKVYQKLVKSCKYFYIKNPILVASRLFYDNNKWQLLSSKETIDMVNVTQKIWITDVFDATHYASINQNIVSSVISNIYKCDAKLVFLRDQVISFNNFCFLASNVEEINFDNTIVKDENGSSLEFEKLFLILSKVQSVSFSFSNTTGCNISSETFNELSKIPHFPKLEFFSFSKVPEAFDLNSFCEYVKKNKLTFFVLNFDDSISGAYENRLKEIIDEILAAKELDYKTPYIYFPGIDYQKYLKLRRICFNY